MSEPILDPATRRLSDALWRALNKRPDFGGTYVWPAFRELIAEHDGFDPLVEQTRVQVALDTGGPNPVTPEELRARASLVGATLHAWYRVPDELRGVVMTAVRELAVIRGERPDEAVFEALAILNTARAAIDVGKERHEALQLEAAQRRQKAKEQEHRRMKARLNVV